MQLEQIWQEIPPRLSTNLLPSQKGTGSFKMNTSAISFYENENRHTIWPRNSTGEKYVPKEATSRMVIAVLFIIVKKNKTKTKTQDTTWMPTSRGAVYQYNKECSTTSKKDEVNLSVCTEVCTEVYSRLYPTKGSKLSNKARMWWYHLHRTKPNANQIKAWN